MITDLKLFETYPWVTSWGNPRLSWILDSTPWISDSTHWIPAVVSGTWILRFKSFVGFRIPWAVFRIPKPRISDSTGQHFTHCGIRIPLHGVSWGLLSLSRQSHAKRGAGQGQLPADAKDKPIRVHLTVDLQLPCSPPPPHPPSFNPKPQCWKSKLITATPVHPGKGMGRFAFDNAPLHWQLSLPRFPFWVGWQKDDKKRGPELVV